MAAGACRKGGPDEEAGLEKRSRRVPEQSAATPPEVCAAIDALTLPELLRLEKYARWRIKGLGQAACGRGHTDLLAVAVTRTLLDKRRWNKDKVGIVGHLLGAMRSISDHWRKEFDPEEEPTLESDLVRTTEEGDILSPFHLIPSGEPTADRALEARERVEAIEKAFAADPVISVILDGLRQGMTPPEVRAELGLSQTEYETAMKRLRRKVPAIAAPGGSHG